MTTITNTAIDASTNININTKVKVKDANNITVNHKQIAEGLLSLQIMFEKLGQPAYPRKIMTADYSGPFTVYDDKQMIDAFKRSNHRDCRVSAYPYFEEPYQKSILVPNLLMLDVDLNYDLILEYDRQHSLIECNRRLNKLLKRLQQKHDINKFMVLYSGNGYHVYIPLTFLKKPLESYKEFFKYRKWLDLLNDDYDNTISEEFLRFLKTFLSPKKSKEVDTANNPNFSSMFLRIPGTINTKTKYFPETIYDQIVRLEHNNLLSSSSSDSEDNDDASNNDADSDDDSNVQEEQAYNGNNNLVVEYMIYLADKSLQHRIKQSTVKAHNLQSETGYYSYIHKLITQVFIDDFRKNAVSLIIMPYLIVTKKLDSDSHVTNIVNDWLNRCNKVRMLDSSYDWDYMIEYNIERSRDNAIPPMGLNRLKERDPRLYARLV